MGWRRGQEIIIIKLKLQVEVGDDTIQGSLASRIYEQEFLTLAYS